MFARYLLRKTLTPEIRAARPYLKRYGMRSTMLWVSEMQKRKRTTN